MLTICTFNIQNDYKKYSLEKSKKIISLLSEYNIDILALQEVYSKIDKDLQKHLFNTTYNIYGRYRYILNFILKPFNEKNPLITNKTIISNKTYSLPFLPSIIKRVATKVEIIDENKKISLYNTHLDVRNEFVKKRQLKKLIKILKKDKNPIILMGDFNLKIHHAPFKEFINELKKININHIDISDRTLKISKYHKAIDHIFISNSFKLVNKKRITNLEFSDHYPIIIKVKSNTTKDNKE